MPFLYMKGPRQGKKSQPEQKKQKQGRAQSYGGGAQDPIYIS